MRFLCHRQNSCTRKLMLAESIVPRMLKTIVIPLSGVGAIPTRPNHVLAGGNVN